MKRGSVESYTVFVRDWWRRPGPGESGWTDPRHPEHGKVWQAGGREVGIA